MSIRKHVLTGRIRLVLAVFFILVPASASVVAHPTTDPNDPVYSAIDRWMSQGYIETRLPLFRPYPTDILRSVLNDVHRRGDVWAQREAQRYLEEAHPEQVTPFVETRLWTRNDEIEPLGTIGIDFSTKVFDSIEIAGNVAGAAINIQDDRDRELLPNGERGTFDIIEDNAKVTVRGREIYTLLDIDTQTTFSTDKLFVTGGIMRRSFGPYYNESPVMSASAPQSANMVFELRGRRLIYTSGVFSFTATTPFAPPKAPGDGANIDLNADGIDDLRPSTDQVPGKLYFLQALTWRALDNLDLTFFESVMMGPRIELAYLVPVKFMWHAQGTAAFYDNSFMGIAADYRPFRTIRIPFTLFVDDASFNDMIRFDFDTKYKIAAATALQWSPAIRFLDKVQLGYEAVFPYMYTHSATPMYSLEPRYRNYLHQNESIGIGLLPNSDRAKVSVDLRPASAFRVSLTGSVMRHANASEDLLTTYQNDGGYFDDGRFGDFEVYDYGDGIDSQLVWKPGALSINNDYRFLQQKYIEKTWQGNIRLLWSPLRSRNLLELSAGYTWEYVQDPIEYVWPGTKSDGTGGYMTDGPDQINHYTALALTYRY